MPSVPVPFVYRGSLPPSAGPALATRKLATDQQCTCGTACWRIVVLTAEHAWTKDHFQATPHLRRLAVLVRVPVQHPFLQGL